MKEHRVKPRPLPPPIRDGDPYGGLQLFRLELELRPSDHQERWQCAGAVVVDPPAAGCCSCSSLVDVAVGRNRKGCHYCVGVHLSYNPPLQPVLSEARQLLELGQYARSAELTRSLLEAGVDPDCPDTEGRTLLTLSVGRLDEAVEVTRVLLNAGASVWGDAFACFLRAVIRRRRLDEGCASTLSLLGQAMAEEPSRMHAAVMRAMFRHAKCYRVLGPVFLEVKRRLACHWTAPQDLAFLSRCAVRAALGPRGGVLRGAGKLGLPRPLKDYLLLL